MDLRCEAFVNNGFPVKSSLFLNSNRAGNLKVHFQTRHATVSAAGPASICTTEHTGQLASPD